MQQDVVKFKIMFPERYLQQFSLSDFWVQYTQWDPQWDPQWRMHNIVFSHCTSRVIHINVDNMKVFYYGYCIKKFI